MKKILIALIAVLSVVSASAQFKVQEKQTMPEVVWRSAMGGHNKLYRQKLQNGEYYYFIGVATTNQFDDKMLIHLGKIDKAKATLLQMANDLYREGEIYELTDDKVEPFTLQCAAFNQYVLFKKGYAGRAYITIGQVEKMLSALEGL